MSNNTSSKTPTSSTSSSSDALDIDRCLTIATQLARDAGALILAAFHSRDKAVENKSALDLVTDTDRACEALILRGLRSAFPSHSFIGEETSDADVKLGDGPTWMVDPLDGTTNFVHRVPFVCVSIGLALKKRPILGVVFAPLLNELYAAAAGKGATLNNTRIHTSGVSELSQALCSTAFPKYREHVPYQLATIHQALVQNVHALRSFGSCALDMCSVAQGRLDAFWESCCICCWDYCAGTVIVREAGGVVCDPLSGGELDLMAHRVCASASGKLATLIVDCSKSRSLPSSIGSEPSNK